MEKKLCIYACGNEFTFQTLTYLLKKKEERLLLTFYDI